MKAYIFPGQGSQYVGMGKDLFDKYEGARKLFERANDILGFRITDMMFSGTDEDLKQTKVTQPAIFLHSVVLTRMLGDDFKPDMVAGHSLGEFSALVANKTLSFEDGLRLVAKRAEAMQKACEIQPSAMAAILGLDDKAVEDTLKTIKNEIVVAANFNSPGQVVISGTVKGVETACEKLKNAGAKRTLILNVGGAFHSPLMEPARVELDKAINSTIFKIPVCPVYQNINAQPVTNPDLIKNNLISQLTSPVRWTQTVQNMIADGVRTFVEVGPGTVLQGLVQKVKKDIEAYSAKPGA
ncbi:MAG: ACP S-malonyltransferase [Bacteroidetes bacterium]|nr:ACP S-malonyltransferase [Bacteroidota bacterium]